MQHILSGKGCHGSYHNLPSLRFMDHDIISENNVKYLGIILDPKLNFNNLIPYLLVKIN